MKPSNDEAYWVSPDGEIYPVPTKHIDMVFDRPELFGLDIEYIESVYDRYNEPYRSEAKARRDILIELFGKGWIRARKYMRPYRWTVNVYYDNESSAASLRKFALQMIGKGHSPDNEVMVDTPAWRKIYSLGELKNIKPGTFRMA